MTANKEELIRDTLDLLTEELGIELEGPDAAKIRDYLGRNLVPKGTVKAKRTRVPKETVRAIVAEYEKMEADGRGSMSTLAKKYGVNISTVQRYVSGSLRGGLTKK